MANFISGIRHFIYCLWRPPMRGFNSIQTLQHWFMNITTAVVSNRKSSWPGKPQAIVPIFGTVAMCHKVLVQCDLNPDESPNQPWRLSASFHHTVLKPALTHCAAAAGRGIPNPAPSELCLCHLELAYCTNKAFAHRICASWHWELCPSLPWPGSPGLKHTWTMERLCYHPESVPLPPLNRFLCQDSELLHKLTLQHLSHELRDWNKVPTAPATMSHHSRLNFYQLK